VIDFGSIPDCAGLAHDDFLDGGAQVEITCQQLDILHLRFAEAAGKRQPSRRLVPPSRGK
jgi:hypothetical protein